MIQEPDPTTPDPVEYIRAWIEYAREKLREKRRPMVQPSKSQTLSPSNRYG